MSTLGRPLPLPWRFTTAISRPLALQKAFRSPSPAGRPLPVTMTILPVGVLIDLTGYHLHTDGSWVPVPGGHYGLVQPVCDGLVLPWKDLTLDSPLGFTAQLEKESP